MLSPIYILVKREGGGAVMLPDKVKLVLAEGVLKFSFDGDLKRLSKELGTLLRDPVSSKFIDELRYHGMGTPSGWMSSGMPAEELPFHTDYPDFSRPPRLVLLRCRAPGEKVVFTQYVHLRPNLLKIFQNSSIFCEPWLIYRGSRWRLTKMCERHGEDVLIRYARNVMRPFMKHSKAEKILEYILSESKISSFLLKENDCLLFDNWAGLHRRAGGDMSEGEGLKRCSDRVIERALISI